MYRSENKPKTIFIYQKIILFCCVATPENRSNYAPFATLGLSCTGHSRTHGIAWSKALCTILTWTLTTAKKGRPRLNPLEAETTLVNCGMCDAPCSWPKKPRSTRFKFVFVNAKSSGLFCAEQCSMLNCWNHPLRNIFWKPCAQSVSKILDGVNIWARSDISCQFAEVLPVSWN